MRFWRPIFLLFCFQTCAAVQVFQDCTEASNYCDLLTRPKCVKKRLQKNAVHALCYTGRNQFTLDALRHAWTHTTFAVREAQLEHLSVTRGGNFTEVKQGLTSGFFSALFSTSSMEYVFPLNASAVPVATFQSQCVGVKYGGKDSYQLATLCIQERVHWRHPMLLAAGVALLFLAPKLCKSVPLQYGTGTAVGILGSLLVLVYIMSKMVPGKRVGTFAFLAAGWSTVAYLLSLVWAQLLDVLLYHWQALLLYVVGSGLLSFAYCYWRGPVTGARSLTVMQWTLQLVAIVLLYCAFQSTVLGVGSVAGTLLWYNFAGCVRAKLRFQMYLLFPPQRRLLSLEEYRRQGEEETNKALAELREHCKRANSWDTVSKLKHPKRFIKFLSGDYHVPSSGIRDYNRSLYSGSSSPESSSAAERSFGSSVPSYREPSPLSTASSSSSSDDDGGDNASLSCSGSNR